MPQTTAALPYTANGKRILSAQADYSKTYPIATRLPAALELREYWLSPADEAAGGLAKLKEMARQFRQAVAPQEFLQLKNALYY